MEPVIAKVIEPLGRSANRVSMRIIVVILRFLPNKPRGIPASSTRHGRYDRRQYPHFTSAFGAKPTWRDMLVAASRSKMTLSGRRLPFPP
jgi:hypothetical protein